MKTKINWIVGCSILLFIMGCKQNKQAEPAIEKPNWIQLFNGNDLDGWTVKIKGRPLGENYKNTFRAENGVMVVNYESYSKFENAFGHIYYKTPFSDYKFRMEYLFVGEQIDDGPAWAYKNSGVLIHCQDPNSIGLSQNFPVSIEVQLLGGDGSEDRPTANVCTPGTHIEMNDEIITDHCIRSNSNTFHDEQWIRLEIEVYNDSLIKHMINGVEVMRYSNPIFGGDVDFDNDKWQLQEGDPLKGGYISLQSESHPVEFRKIELLNLTL